MLIKSQLMLVFLVLLTQGAGAQGKPTRFEIGPVFSVYHTPQTGFTSADWSQLGGRFTWNFLPHLSLEAEFDSSLKPSLGTTFDAGGYFSQGLLGVKTGLQWKNWGLFAKFRPGFIRYSTVITSSNIAARPSIFTFGTLTNSAFDLGGGAEFFISRHFLFRYDLGDLLVHQGARPFPENGQQFTELSFTQNHFEAEAGLAFRF